MQDLIGKLLANRYHIVSLIGSGTRGLVYLAYDKATGRPVAVKTVQPDFSESPGQNQVRFEREAKLLADLQHPNIVKLYETVIQDDTLYMIVEYVAGQDLQRRLREQPGNHFSLQEALLIFRQISWALHYAHQENVFHRDVKPQNILLGSNNRVYLADFGLALVTDWTRITQTEVYLGTPLYASPEQWAAPDTVDARSDIYSLGVLLYEMLTGQCPFGAYDGIPDLIEKVLSVPAPSPTLVNPSIPTGVEQVILQALAKAPQDRYPDVLTMLSALESAAGSPPKADTSKEAVDALATHIMPGNAADAATEPDSVDSADATPPAPSRRAALRWRDALFLAAGVSLAVLLILAGVSLGARFPSALPMSLSSVSPTPQPTATPTDAPTFTPTPTPTPSPHPSSTATATVPTPSPTVTPSPTYTLTPSPQPPVLIGAAQIGIYGGPGEHYDQLGQAHRVEPLSLLGQSGDGQWWLINYGEQEGWIQAHTVDTEKVQLPLPVYSAPPTPTKTTAPAETPTPTPGPTPGPEGPQREIAIYNPGFDGIRNNHIPGWLWWAYDNYRPGEGVTADTAYAKPVVRQADDYARMISGDTLQIETIGAPKFKVYVFQTFDVRAGTVARFQVASVAYCRDGSMMVRAGIDPNGGYGCDNALWGEMLSINQSSGEMYPSSPNVRVGEEGKLTMCIYAEPMFDGERQAVFFDNAWLIVNPH